MLSAVIPEYPVIHFNFLSVIGRWIQGIEKVLKPPIRVELKKVVTERPDGPVAIIHTIYPADGKPRETYTYWDGGPLDTSGTFFFDRDAIGKIVRIVPPEEEAVPDEWKTALKKFDDKSQQAPTQAVKKFG